jgi:hypothetical protein
VDVPALITPLLYFTSFTAALALFASTIALVFWALKKTVVTLIGVGRAMKEPPSRLAHRVGRDLSIQPNHLKRAGQ